MKYRARMPIAPGLKPEGLKSHLQGAMSRREVTGKGGVVGRGRG